jgi:hypothetical protein
MGELLFGWKMGRGEARIAIDLAGDQTGVTGEGEIVPEQAEAD